MYFSSLLIAFIVMALVFFLPGFIILSIGRRIGNKIPDLSFMESAFIIILISLLVSGITGISLAAVGGYSSINLIIVLSFFCFLIILLYKPRLNDFRLPKPNRDWECVFILLILAVLVAILSRPFEEIMGYGDAYIHVNIGGIIANHGSIIYHDWLLTSLPRNLIDDFLFKPNQLFNNLIISDFQTGEVNPSFLHLFATYIGMFLSVLGLNGALYATGVFGGLSVIGMYLLLKRLMSFRTAALFSFLFAISYLQIWFSRSHSAEILLQFLLIAMILMFILYLRTQSPMLGIISALCLGLAFLTKVEATILLIPVFLYFSYLNMTGNLGKFHFYFIVTLMAMIIYTVVYYVRVGSVYVYGSFFASDVPQELLIIVIVAALSVNIVPHKYWGRILTILRRCKRCPQHAFALALLIYLSYCAITLPQTDFGYNGRNLEMLSWYLSPLLLGVGLTGLVLLFYRPPFNETYFILGILGIFFILYAPNIHHGWGGPWWMRRYLFAVIPLLFIGAAYAYYSVSRIRRRNLRRALLASLACSLAVMVGLTSFPIWDHSDYDGAVQQTKDIFEGFPEESILVFADVSYPHIAYPLREIFGKNALLMNRSQWGVLAEPKSQGDIEEFCESVEIWIEQNHTVYVINPTNGFLESFEERLGFDLVRTGRVELPYLEIAIDKMPSNFITIEREYRIFKVTIKQT